MENISAAWCIFGDFNAVRFEEERFSCQFYDMEVVDFNHFISTAQLVEIPLGGKRYTRVSDDGVKFSKLDRFLDSENFNSVWCNLA